jgi:hypothetical protein
MKKTGLILAVFICWAGVLAAQQPSQLVMQAYRNFMRVKDYSADIQMDFDIPSVHINSIKGKVFFKQPDKFRIRTSGIIFLPKQNPYYALTFLGDSTGYTAVASGTEKIGTTSCSVVTVLPSKDGDIILGKFWIDPVRSLVLRTQLTTRSNGLIQIDNTYNAQPVYPLPQKIQFTVDMTKFKVPKAISVDINSRTGTGSYNQKGTGYITLTMDGYTINQKLSDSVFTEESNK